MDVKIIQRAEQRVAYLRVIGPYEQSLPPGFQHMMQWSETRGLEAGDWMALYWDDPNVTPPEQLKADVALSVPDDTEVDGDVQLQTIPAGDYAMYACRVENNDFATPWLALFKQWLPQSAFQLWDGPCFEQYLNNGNQDGYWDLLLFIPLQKK